MRNLNFLKLFYGLMLVMVSTAFVSCVDDNDDTEAPYLEVSPTTLIFGLDGQPANGSQASFDISTNRSWKATVKDDKSWVTLSKYEGEGSATIQVSIPENVNDEASVVIEISNKVGVLMSETVKISSGSVEPSVVIYNDNVGTIELDKTNWPFVDKYEGWNKTGVGSESVTYTGVNASVRNSGLANTDAYAGASGPNVVFFGKTPTNFNVNTITLTSEQKNLQLTFGASRSVNNNGTYDNTFDVSKFEVALSADGTAWVPITYTKNNGDADYPYWVFATANFTLKQVPENLYIRFTALDASAIRLDDITLATGAGGTEIDFGTAGEPKVTTTDAKAITATTATLGGSVANIEISEATEVGVQYIEFSTGTVTDIDWTKATKTAASVKENPWTVAVTNLTKDNQYAFRAYATTASSTIYGEPKTFVATESTATPISIADLVTKMTSTSTAVDENYVIQGIICGDPAGKNYSYGTLYLMSKGATTAGNALSLYNNQIDVTQYALGQEIKERIAEINRAKESLGSEYQDNGLLICQPDGRPIDPNNLCKSFKEWQSAMNITDQIDLQGLRKSGQMHKIRLTKNNYQLVAANAGQSPEVLMHHYNEALEVEKQQLASMVESSFYPTPAKSNEKPASLDAAEILKLIQENPDLSAKLMQLLKVSA